MANFDLEVPIRDDLEEVVAELLENFQTWLDQIMLGQITELTVNVGGQANAEGAVTLTGQYGFRGIPIPRPIPRPPVIPRPDPRRLPIPLPLPIPGPVGDQTRERQDNHKVAKVRRAIDEAILDMMRPYGCLQFWVPFEYIRARYRNSMAIAIRNAALPQGRGGPRGRFKINPVKAGRPKKKAPQPSSFGRKVRHRNRAGTR